MTDHEEPTASSQDNDASRGHPMLVYTSFRLLLFAVPFGLLMAVGAQLVWALLIAALASSIASIFVLGRYRDRLSLSLSERQERVRTRMAQRESSEDAWDDEQRSKPDDIEGPASDDGRSH